MAVTHSSKLYLLLNKYCKKNVFLALGYKVQYLAIPVNYSTTLNDKPEVRNTLKSCLEKAAKSDEFLKEQLKEFELGKKFLASMMGKESQLMTQKDIDEAIEYLFPSALFVSSSRPLMKPPEEIFGKSKSADFDENGRPYHYLFYTLKPKFSQCLHDAAETLERLNGLLYKNLPHPKPLILAGGGLLSQKEIEEKFSERLYHIEYDKFLEVFNELIEHPFAIEAEDFIKSCWKSRDGKAATEKKPTVVTKDNIRKSTITGVRRKSAIANVTVSSPGSGKIRINNVGIDYFINITPREQV